jgi:hypothetical protein
MSILDQYTHAAPSPQAAIDIFKGEWTSQLPLPDLNSGSLPVFEDPRIEWAVAQMGGVKGKTVLELGPLEGGHTYMLERLGAKSVVAVEANARAYLKCLIVKELLGLERAQFLYGDFLEYLRQTSPKFDVCIASGVLYHMREPIELNQATRPMRQAGLCLDALLRANPCPHKSAIAEWGFRKSSRSICWNAAYLAPLRIPTGTQLVGLLRWKQ